jgi:CxxC motif-containing protein
MTTKEMVCIVCPIGCNLKAELNDQNEVISVTGNTCARGDVYARKELTNPTRMLTSTIKIKGAIYERLPVITSSDIPKGKLFDVMQALLNIEVEAPVHNKDIIIKNVCDLGVDIIASRTMEKVHKE